MAGLMELWNSIISNSFGRFNKTDSVDYVKGELVEILPRYARITDCLKGQDAIKKNTYSNGISQPTSQGYFIGYQNNPEVYLPMPNKADQTQENLYRYAMYKERAVFYPVLQQTSLGLIGQCFIYDPIVEVPEKLKIMMTNVDGINDIYQFAKKALSYNVNYSRAGILTDYPNIDETVTVSDSDEINPSLICYSPEDIINWRVRRIKNKNVLSLVVIRECIESENYFFKEQYFETYRVLKLDDSNEYVQEIWQKNEKGEIVLKESFEPKYGGKRFNFIPFVFLGSESNTPDICDPQMDAIAVLNIAHYRNSADYEDSSYNVGQPTPVFTGITENWVKKVLNGVVRLGSVGSISLPVGGDAKLLQALPNSMPIEGMKHKEDQMLSLGAKIIQPSNIVKTATESTMDKSDENSILTCTSKNTSVGVQLAIKWAYMFKTGQDSGEEYEKIKFELRTESALANMTANERMQTVADWQAGAITYRELRTVYKKAGIAYEDLETPPELPKTQEMMKQEEQEKMKPEGTVNPSSGRDFIGNSKK